MRAFREKFGRGWDAERMGEVDAKSGGEGEGEGGMGEEVEDNLMDLIGGYGVQAESEGTAKGLREEKARSGKGKGGEK